MKVLSLQALREQQNGKSVESGNEPSIEVVEKVRPPATESAELTTPVVEKVPPSAVVRQQIQTPQRGLRGYTRILPPGKNSVADLDGDWIIEFWDKPSPWCSIEGEPVHPEFDGNLKSFEGAA